MADLIAKQIPVLKYRIALLEFASAQFDDVKEISNEFTSEKASKHINGFDIKENPYWLEINPCHFADFEYDGKIQTVKIYTYPRRLNLAGIRYKDDTIYFYKNNLSAFNKDLKLKIRQLIADFITKHSDKKIDDTNLDPKIKKLIAFT